MCLIAFLWRPGSPEPLRLAANRDEFHARPTAPLSWWEGGRILAGRDLQAGGTWLGLSRDGRLAALTNFRSPAPRPEDAPSRGTLPAAFLAERQSARAFVEDLRPTASAYAPFNLLLFDGEALVGYESRHDRAVAFDPGLHVVSNGDFDEPWPKAEALRAALTEGFPSDAELLRILADERRSSDAELPRTGVPLEIERALSPIFVRTPTYGTRVSTLVRVGRSSADVLEQGYEPIETARRTEIAFDF
ncbi:NRDE family protein [Geothrix sp. 21YS21S-4]|uniref:NRDE family protein n=1 Tax=Geothrix sp. 21YS21S-4 TaxID=3068889 RepID=UPI0027BA4411|nr:NRDE family protein [Geothrix sp. 21YS21S-4]